PSDFGVQAAKFACIRYDRVHFADDCSERSRFKRNGASRPVPKDRIGAIFTVPVLLISPSTAYSGRRLPYNKMATSFPFRCSMYWEAKSMLPETGFVGTRRSHSMDSSGVWDAGRL